MTSGASLTLLLLPVLAFGDVTEPDRGAKAPESRAVAFLTREVPRWSRENRCFSCHNNGDAARALFAATKSGYVVPAEALATTVDFLADPERWQRNGVDAAFSDKSLARLQFADALADAFQLGVVKDRGRLVMAALKLVEDQSADGSWPIEATALIGSPATYGPTLATVLARRTLVAADPTRFDRAIARAERWLRERPAMSVLDGSALLFANLPMTGPEDKARRRQWLEMLRKGQSDDGGWGPFVNSPPEVFDTALAVLALANSPERKEVEPLLARGRAYLIAAQEDDGGWPETTRPSGGESYAQRLSTTGWATLALLATE